MDPLATWPPAPLRRTHALLPLLAFGLTLGLLGCGDSGPPVTYDFGFLVDQGLPAVDAPADARLAPGPDRPACRPGGEGCQGFSECCSGICAEQLCTFCTAPGEACGGDGDCCQGLVCRDGACAACETGALCSRDSDCCGDLVCYQGRCGAACLDDDEDCILASDCCSNICDNGSCTPCGRERAECSTEAQCCPGIPCADGNCCLGLGQACLSSDTGTNDCCTGACEAATEGGADLRCCQPPSFESRCTADADCCGKGRCEKGSYCCAPPREPCGYGGACCDGWFCGDEGLCCIYPGPTEETPCSADSDCCGESACVGARCCSAEYNACESDADCCPGLACDLAEASPFCRPVS